MKEPNPLDDRRKLIVPGNHEETIAFALEHFIRVANEAIQERGAFFVALSGGSTPKEIYQKLATPQYNERIDWPHVHLFWSDERSVPPTSTKSNYHMALDAGFKNLPIPKEHIHRMIAEENIEENSKKYEALVKENPFDLIMLGMGGDGHTASLFPDTEALNETTRLVVPNHVPLQKTWRMTFTYPLINAARHTAIYVLGEGKQERIKTVLQPTPQAPPYPIQKIGTPEHPTLWIIDTAAAAQLAT